MEQTMKSITIHGLDDRLSHKISEAAKREGQSLNKTIKSLLEQALGLGSRKTTDHRDEFAEFLGLWSDKESKEFDDAIKDFEEINPEDWK